MGKRKRETTRSQIRSALRQLFLRSRERAEAVKRDKNTCQKCFRKASKAKGKEFKVQVHHKVGIIPNWELLIDEIYKYLLCTADDLEVLCKPCHNDEHGIESKVIVLKHRRKKRMEELKPCGFYLMKNEPKLRVRR